MDQEIKKTVIERQDRDSFLLNKKMNVYREAEDVFNNYFRMIENDGSSFLDKVPNKRSLVLQEIINLKANDNELYKNKTKELYSKFPILKSKEFKECLFRMQQLQYEYYSELVKYLNQMNEDYSTLFTSEYKKRTFEMAKKGLFVFYEQTPDLEDVLCDDAEKNIELFLAYLEIDDFGPLLQMLSGIFDEDDPSDFLRTIKTRELKEAVSCLINNCYGSCARTMLALIENEHTNASNINSDLFEDTIIKGRDRSIAITEQLGSINISYFSDCWALMNDYYKEITAKSSEKSTRYINRNEVVHGVYWNSVLPDKKACIELILFYLSFKTISFFLQQIFEMKNTINNDMLAVMATLGEQKA